MLTRFFVAATIALAAVGANAQPSQTDAERVYRELQWLPPGGTGTIAGKATFKASTAYTFLNPADTDKFLELNGNPPQGSSVTIAPTKGEWFGVLSFAPEGYVKDDESIDADALLKTLKSQNLAGNEEKRKLGYQTLTLEGWALAPRYDKQNQRLEWGTLLRAEDQSPVVNVSTRILGRSGYTAAILVTNPATLESDLHEFKTALKNFEYVDGEKYSEWREGDKVAAYGLGALVLGGAAAAVSSKGGFKVIGLAVAAAAAAVWAGLKKIFSGRKS
jgi:uncharacterized membrane-anchored protein